MEILTLLLAWFGSSPNLLKPTGGLCVVEVDRQMGFGGGERLVVKVGRVAGEGVIGVYIKTGRGWWSGDGGTEITCQKVPNFHYKGSEPEIKVIGILQGS